jgi:competence protein CoiA
MLTALAHNELVIAKDVCKDDGPFLCLECAAHLQLKKGTIKAHHFAHLVDAGCRCGYGEGERHRQLKEEICVTLASSSQVRSLQQERRELKLVYPDISFWCHGKGWVAVEVQVTDISVDTIQRRVQTYTERGIALLWVLPCNEALVDGERYRPTRWERYLHALYRGKLFYWSPEQRLQLVSLKDMTTTGEPFVWYQDKEAWLAVGRPRKSQIYKRVHLHQQVGVLDLGAITYPAWQRGSFFLPKARLWTLKPEPPVSKRRIAL